MRLVATLAMAILTAFGSGTSPAFAGDKPIREQIVEIVSSRKATVRKWTRAPRVLVLHDRAAPKDFFEGMVAEITAAAPSFPGVASIDYVDLGAIGAPLAGGARFRVKQDEVEGGVAVSSGFLIDGYGAAVADIYVFLTDIPTGVLFAALTQSSGPLPRRFAEGAPHSCYYTASSLNDVLRYGMVFINSAWDMERVQACMFEEFMHTLGILNDSEASEHFTFNDRVADPVDRLADFALLEALYSESVLPGDPPDRVADAFLLNR
ncbi:DUF2927 domain-containing protein [Algicella marina]|uniref:DUF2927 domain-containing protein n=1 Tax=Algicella marina TaxID=2683284 RepID=A0A6P1SXV6_9RHOB|nr:DUF2927 domain-containing protein [Algicella marina]QHQ34046.1 DUF2927 domain-containing protein [Algicella marina]